MTARPTWKGLLKIALVTIPIKVFPATESSDGLTFNQLHSSCQTRVTQKRWCGSCKREVPAAEIAKGFEFEPGKYVLLSETDLASVRPTSTHVIDLTQFAVASALDALYVNRTYYLAPDSAGEAFAVMRAGMQGMVGLGKLAIYGREYLVAVRPRGKTLLLHTLHHAAEIREAFEDWMQPDTKPVIVPAAQVRLARQVVAAFTQRLDLAAFQDDYKAGLQRVIDSKIAGQQIVVAPIDTPPVVSLREALTQSLLAVSATKKTPAKVVALKKKRAS